MSDYILVAEGLVSVFILGLVAGVALARWVEGVEWSIVVSTEKEQHA